MTDGSSSSPALAEFGWPGGDVPGELTFPTLVTGELSAAILLALQERGAGTVHALTPPQGPIGRYKVETASRPFFVRISSHWGDPGLEQAVTAHLEAHGVPVNHVERAGLHFPWEGRDYRLDARPLLRGRHFTGTLAELRAVAAALRACHGALLHFPRAAEVRAYAGERFAQDEALRAPMARALGQENWGFFGPDAHWARAHADWLGQLVASFRPRYDLSPDAQCLHAQMHRGNVILAQPDDRPVLLDFEWATHTYAPPSWDLAYFLQRFAMYDEPATPVLQQRLAVVREAYGPWGAGVPGMMRQMAWLSVATIVRQWQDSGIANPRAEYDKFVFLEGQARHWESLLEEYARA